MDILNAAKRMLAPALLGVASTLCVALPVFADDTEIYVSPPVGSVARPNILFVVDTSGSMGWTDAGETKTRMQFLQEALNDTLNNADKDINVAITEYYSSTVRAVSAPFLRLQDHRQTLLNAVNSLIPGGGTPTTDALRAGVEWFDNGWSGYNTPIEYSCQSNQVVLMTDGRPNTSSQTQYNGQTCNDLSGSEYNYIPADRKTAVRCAFEIAAHGITDLFPDDPLDAKTKGNQTVSTSTVAFNLGDPWAQTLMQNLATAGGGTYYPASDAADLKDAFEDAIGQLPNVTGLEFTPPAVPVNSSNRLFSSDKAYFGLFKPSQTDYWVGNFKKYGLEVRNGDQLTLVDAQTPAQPVVQNGQFKTTAQSYWNSLTDGNDVEQGGAAARLGANRNTYTYLGDPNGDGNTLDANPNLAAAVNSLDVGNSNITFQMLGLADATKRDALLNWIHGIDVKDSDGDTSTTDARGQMGAALHTSPALINYDSGLEVAYITTTEGYLHAFNTATGDELFAYMPEQLLGEIERLYDDETTQADSSIPYGLDGPMTAWHNDINKDGIVNGADHVYLYFGMRRGGNSYFAIDVTSSSAPKYLWTLTGGSGNFAGLGQTWSKPQLMKVRTSASDPVDALVFGGGYDTNQDVTGVARSNDSTGNAIYIIDASTGNRLWYADKSMFSNLQISTMLNSIPADVRALDLDQDGVLDRIYAADTGGRVFRVDIDDDVDIASSGSATGGAIADINDGTVAGNRRFYNAPDIVLITKGVVPYLAIAIGSGHRARPANEDVTDRFYVLKDTSVFSAPATYLATGELALTDASATTVTSGTGWYITMSSSGEKVLAVSTTLDHKLFFTTYTPDVVTSTDPCEAGSLGGQGRLYGVDIRTTNAVFNFDGSADPILELSDRSKAMSSSGIPGQIAGINSQAVSSGSGQSGLVTDIWSGLEEEGEILRPMINTLWLEIE